MSQKNDMNESFENLAVTDNKLGKTMNRKSRKAVPKRHIKRIKDIVITDRSDFVINSEFKPKLLHKPKKKGPKPFGKLYEALLKGENVICRLIEFERLTSYITEELYEEIQVTSSIWDDSIVRIKGLYIDNSKVYLFYPVLTSLYDYLHIQENKLTNAQKYEIATQISKSLTKIHSCKLSFTHGHLSSRNLFIQSVVEENQIKHKILIGDLGDMSIRQHAKIFHDYDIRNTWASPEVLADSNFVFANKKQAVDIYSFGMLLWELFSRIVPFADNLEGATMYVIEKNCRPKIKYAATDSDDEGNDVVPSEIADVINKWWAKEPSERPPNIMDVNEMMKLIDIR